MRRGPVAWFLTFVLVLTLLPIQAQALPPFWDILGTHWQEPVQRLNELAIVSGNPDGTFGPKDNVTRAQMAAFAVRALGEHPGTAGSTAFSDVAADDWAAGFIAKASERKLIQGADGKFRPGDYVTYGEAMAILVRMLGYESDVQGGWPVGYITMARELGLIAPLRSFEFAAPMSRGEVVLALDAAVFQVPVKGTQYTLSQGIHRKAKSLAIFPDASAIPLGTIQLEANGLDAVGKPFPAASSQWRLISGDATLTDTGKITTRGGAVTVRVTADGRTTERTYDVISRLSVEGLEGLLKVGESVKLTVNGVTSNGTEIPVPATLTLVRGSAELSADGTLRVTGAGDIEVKANFSGLETVGRGVAGSGLAVSPNNATLVSGETVVLTATSGGVTLNGVVWSVVNGDGQITKDGTFTAGLQTSKVRAQAGTLSAEATVEVYNSLVIEPIGLDLTRGDTATVTATLRSASGKELAVQPTWSVQSPVAIIDVSGRVVATSAGRSNIVATYKGLTGTAPIAVAGDPARIEVSAAKTTLIANGKSSTTLTAKVVDGMGNVVRGAHGTIFFTLGSSGMGSFTNAEVNIVNGEATTTYVAGVTTGSARIMVGSRTLTLPGGYVDLTLQTVQVGRVELSVAPAVMSAAANARATVDVRLVDQDGQEMRNNQANAITVSLYANGPAALQASQVVIGPGQSSVQTALVSSGQVGTVTVTGSAIVPVTSTTLKTTIAAPASKLVIRPVTAVRADNFTDAVIQVEVQDENGSVRTNDSGMAVTLFGTLNGVPVTGLPQQSGVINGVATFRIRSSKAGAMSLTARSGNLTAGVGTAEFLPGVATRINLVAVPSDLDGGSKATINADGGVSVITLRAEVVDASGNRVTTSTDPITFTREVNGKATKLPDTLTIHAIQGVAELQVASTINVGTDVFRASAPGLVSSAAVNVNAKIVGVPDRIQILTPANIPAGAETTITVRLVDSQNFLVTNSNGLMVNLQSTSTTFHSNGPQPTVNGVATFKISDTRVGTWQLSATAEGRALTVSPITWVVTGGAASRVRLVATPESIPTDGNTRAAITAQVTDDFGNVVGSSTTIQLTTTAGVLSSGTLTAGGTVYLSLPAGVPSNATVSGTASSGMVAEPVVVKSYVPAEPSRVVVEIPANQSMVAGPVGSTPVQIKVKVLDVNGNVATQVNTNAITSQAGLMVTGMSGTNTTTITNAGGAGLVNYGFTPNGVTQGSQVMGFGVASFYFTNSKAETVTLTPIVYYNGRQLPATPSTLTTKPRDAYQLVIDGINSAAVADGHSTISLTARVTDVYGNTVPVSGDRITVSLERGDFVQLQGDTAVTTNNGVATFVLLAKTHATGGSTAVRFDSEKTGLTSTGVVYTDQPPVQPRAFGYAAMGGGTTISTASGGLYVQVMAQPRSSNQTVHVYVNGVRVNVYATLTGDVPATQLAGGQSLFSGYVRYGELGGPGLKEVKVVLISPVGASPFSESFYVTVTP